MKPKDLKKQFHHLIKEENSKKLEEFVLNNFSGLLQLLTQAFETSTKDAPLLVNSLLSAFQKDSPDNKHLKIQVFQQVIEFLRNQQPNERESGDLVTCLMMHADNLSTEDLVSLIDFYLSSIKSDIPFEGRWTELLGKLFSLMIKRENIIYHGKALEGEDFVYKILKSICESKWCVKTTISLLQILKELKLGNEELSEFLHHVGKTLNHIDFQSIPSVMYHLVLLGHENLPKEVLRIILNYFKEKEEQREKSQGSDDLTDIGSINEIENFEELTDIEGTVALHITHFSQYNPNLVKEYLKDIKNSTWLPENLITPFNLILLLSLSSIERYRDQIVDSMKSCILKSFRFSECESKSLWLHGTFKGNFNLLTTFQKSIANCKTGWVQVYDGLVHLSFSLLESGGGPKADTYATKETIFLASRILSLTVKKEPILALKVLKKLSCYFYTASNPCQYIDLLSQLVASSPLILLEHLNILQELLENISFLGVTVATMLIHSLLPLIKMNLPLKDSLMLILRKMLYSKQVENRQISVQGFLLFLHHFKVMGTLPSSQVSTSFSSSFSQVSVEVHTGMNANTNEAFCFELLGILRRVLSQQYQVKSHLYIGLFDVIRSNPKLASNILLMLRNQTTAFLDVRDFILNPIVLKEVVVIQGDSAIQVEPIGQLLTSLSLCYSWFSNYLSSPSQNQDTSFDQEEEEEISSLLKSISSTFDCLIEKLKKADLDDLDLNKDSFSQADAEGKQTIMHAETMVSVFDALMQHSFVSGALQSLDKMRDVLLLFKTQRKIVETVTAKASAKPAKKVDAGKGKRKGAQPKISLNFKSILGMRIPNEMLKICFDDEDEALEECAKLLQENSEMQVYLLSVMNHEITSMKELVPYQRKKFIPYLKTLGSSLLKECSRCLAQHDPDDSRELERMRTCLSTFANIISCSQKFFKDKFTNIVKEISGMTPMGNLQAYLYSICKKCQEMLKRIIFHEENEKFLKDAVVLIHLIKDVSLQMEPASKEIKKIQDWLHQLCKDQSINSAPVCESLVTALLSITDQTHEKNFITRSFARELHSHFGDIDPDVSLDREGKYKIISDVSAGSILTCLLSYFESSLTTIDMVVLCRLKAILLSHLEGSSEIEKNVSLKFALVIQSLSEFLITALPLGSSIDSVIKIATKLYHLLCLYVRYYLDLFRLKPVASIPEEFEKMVNLSNTLIKTQILNFINYENDTQLKENKKKKVILAARVQKESKLIPSLIFNMEKYEALLLTLSKKSSVDLLINVKLGTNRDFKINVPVLEQIAQNGLQDDDEEEEEQQEEGSEGQEEESEDDACPPPSKKKK